MQQKLDDLYERGMDAFAKSDYKSAEKAFVAFLEENPNFADIRNKMGVIYNQTNRLDLAVKSFKKALELNPGYTEASLNLAITYSDLGRYELSREVFEGAARFTHPGQREIDPYIKGKLSNEHLRVGCIYYELGLFEYAIEEYHKALRLSPAFADIITQLGIALRDNGQQDEAIKEFTRAKELNPQYIPAWLHLGITYYARGFYGLAEEEWREALKVDPDNAALKTYLTFVKPQTS